MSAPISLWCLIRREGRFRLGNALLGAVAVALAVAVWAACLVVMRGHDARTARALEALHQALADETAVLADGMRRATLKLQFNLVILPAGQDLRAWHTDSEIRGTLPETHVEHLARAEIVTIQHLLPIVQRRLFWEEQGRRIILVGTRGEVAQLHSAPKKPLVQPVSPGGIVLGHELHRSLGLKPGQRVVLMGREFTVQRCHEQRGSQDDITAWIDLAAAQELLGMRGQVHAILALECLCAGLPEVEAFRADIRRFLPDTDIIELGSKAFSRADARLSLAAEAKASAARAVAARRDLRQARQRLAGVLVPLAFLGGLVAVGALAASNARARTAEMALLRALGVPSWKLLAVLLARYGLLAVPAALAGCVAGSAAGALLAAGLDPVALPGAVPFLTAREAAGAAAAALAATVLAAWLPALSAARRDPAAVLSSE